jgi:hypothetical protein
LEPKNLGQNYEVIQQQRMIKFGWKLILISYLGSTMPTQLNAKKLTLVDSCRACEDWSRSSFAATIKQGTS